MNIYLVSQSTNNGYDTYSDFVIVAESEDQAKKTSPCGNREWDCDNEYWVYLRFDGTKIRDSNDSWVNNIKSIKVDLIGKANNNIKPGIVITSFHAG